MKYQQIQPSVRIYDIWPGNNIFYLNGRIMFGLSPDQSKRKTVWLIHISISTIVISLSKYLFVNQVGTVPWIILYQYLVVFLQIVLIQITDPGIIPSYQIQQLMFGRLLFPYNIGQISYQHYLEINHQDLQINQKRFRSLNHNDLYSCETILTEQQFGLLKKQFVFCDDCQIYRPFRSRHCQLCNNCVEMAKHHCHISSNCIGRRNFNIFVVLMVQASVLFIFAQFFMFYCLKSLYYWAMGLDNSENSFIGAILQTGYQILFIFSVFFQLMVLLLLLFQRCFQNSKVGQDLGWGKQPADIMEQKYDFICKSVSLLENVSKQVDHDKYELFKTTRETDILV